MHKVRSFVALAGSFAAYAMLLAVHVGHSPIGQFGGIGQYINQ